MDNNILTNDNLELTPKTTYSDPVMKFDFPDVEVGIGEYDEGPTGCTVFYFPKGPANIAYNVGGGAPGTILTRGLRQVDAICFAGGAVLGLEATSGVMAELLKKRNYSVGWDDIPSVSGAIIYDYLPRNNSIYPDRELGRAAFMALQKGVFPLGAQGAGRSATVGKTMDMCCWESSGQGGAFMKIGDTRIAVFTLVNAMGAIIDRDGKVIRGHYNIPDDRREGSLAYMLKSIENRKNGETAETIKGNCTLTLAVTNQEFDREELQFLAQQLNCSMARTIHPYHTMDDGDSVFVVSTGGVANSGISLTEMGVLMSETAREAVLSAIPR